MSCKDHVEDIVAEIASILITAVHTWGVERRVCQKLNTKLIHICEIIAQYINTCFCQNILHPKYPVCAHGKTTAS